MKELKHLPDNATLDKLIEAAKLAEKKAKELYDSATEIDEKWRIKLEKRRKLEIEKETNID